MRSHRRPKIEDEEWESRKDTIKKLFLDDEKTINQIIKIMKRDSQFDASKPQYETRFNKWGLHKNISQRHWVLIGKIVRAGEQQGLHSVVWHHNRPIPDVKVRHNMSRYHDQIKQFYDATQDLNAVLPSWIQVAQTLANVPRDRPAKAPNEDTVASSSNQRSEPNSEGGDIVTFRSHRSTMESTTALIPPNRDQSSEHQYRCASLEQDILEEHSFLKIQRRTKDVILSRVPSDSFTLLEHFVSTMNDSVAQTIILSPVLLDFLQAHSRSILPSRINLQLASANNARIMFSIAINCLINNHLKDPIPIEWLLSVVQRQPVVRVIQLLDAVPSVFGEALAYNLLQFARSHNAYEVVKAICKSNKANSQLTSATLLLWAARHGQREIFEFAAAHMTTPQAALSRLSIEFHRVVKEVERVNIPHFIDLIISKRSALDTLHIFTEAIREGAPQIAKALLPYVSLRSYFLKFWLRRSVTRSPVQREFEKVLAMRDEAFSLHVFQSFIGYYHNHGARDAARLAPKKVDWLLRNATVEAIIFNQLEVARLLADSVKSKSPDILYETIKYLHVDLAKHLIQSGFPIKNQCLTIATKKRDLTLIRILLEHGASPNVAFRVSKVDSSRLAISPCFHTSEIYRTSHSVAVEMNFKEAIKAFEQVASKPYKSEHQASLIFAAAKTGILEVITGHLPRDFTNIQNGENDRVLLHTLGHALLMLLVHRHMTVAEILLSAGVKLPGGLCDLANFIQDAVVVKSILSHDCEVSANQEVACLAAETGDRDLAEAVFQHVDRQDLYTTKVLLSAIEGGNIDIIKLLLQENIRCQLPIDSGLWSSGSHDGNPYAELVPKYDHTPLTKAVLNGDMAMTKLFLEMRDEEFMQKVNSRRANKKCDYWRRENITPSVLEVATFRGNHRMVEHLIAVGNNCQDIHALRFAVQSGDHVLVQRFLQGFKCSPDSLRFPTLAPALATVVYRGDEKLFNLFKIHMNLRDVTTPFWISNGCQHTALGAALAASHVHAMAMLKVMVAEAGTYLNAVAEYHCHSHFDNGESMACNISRGPAGLVAGSMTPLMCAIVARSTTKIDLLLANGADINRSATAGVLRTPLQLASELGDDRIVEHLLRKGAEVNAEPSNRLGGTALQLAAIKGHVSIAERLIGREALVNAIPHDYKGRTAFEGAAEWGRLDMMLLLVRHGADLTSPEGEKQYKRAIQFAEEYNQRPAVELARKLRDVILAAEAKASDIGNNLDQEDFPQLVNDGVIF